MGPNGCGKSTLLKTLVDELPPLAGQVQRGSGVRLGYYDQKLGTLDESRSLIDEVRSVRADLSPEAVRQYLARFRFFDDDPFRVVGSLSGGERSRLSMAKMMLFPRNVLALDEPTNHLDIPAREVLEEALVGYEGTLIVVSHDRYFLDRVCGRLLVFEEGGLESHLGNYSDWRSRRAASRPPVGRARGRAPPRRRPPPSRPGPATRTGIGSGAASSGGSRRWRRTWPSWRRSCRRCGPSCRENTAATGKSCTSWPTGNARPASGSPVAWKSGRQPARPCSESPGPDRRAIV